MGTYNSGDYTKKIYDSGLELFTSKTLRDVLSIKKESTFFGVVRRLLRREVLKKIERDKFYLANSKIDSFSIAGFLYSPSYISFETALSFYGILSQFPYTVTSATTKKPKSKIFENVDYEYTHITKKIFWGFEKKDNFLIAYPEKALLDQLYLVSKGLRSLHIDEIDVSNVNKSKFEDYLKGFPGFFKFRNLATMVREKFK